MIVMNKTDKVVLMQGLLPTMTRFYPSPVKYCIGKNQKLIDYRRRSRNYYIYQILCR